MFTYLPAGGKQQLCDWGVEWTVTERFQLGSIMRYFRKHSMPNKKVETGAYSENSRVMVCH